MKVIVLRREELTHCYTLATQLSHRWPLIKQGMMGC